MNKNFAAWYAASMLFGDYGIAKAMEKEFGSKVGSAEEELTPEEKEKKEKREKWIREKEKEYEFIKSKGDRNLKTIAEIREKNGLPPLKFGKRSDEK